MQVPISQCGAAAGLAYSAGVYSAPATTTAHKTVCCKHIFSNIFTLENYFYSNFNLFHCFQLPQYLFELPFSQMPLNIAEQLMELTVMDSNYRISKGVVNDYRSSKN